MSLVTLPGRRCARGVRHVASVAAVLDVVAEVCTQGGVGQCTWWGTRGVPGWVYLYLFLALPGPPYQARLGLPVPWPSLA